MLDEGLAARLSALAQQLLLVRENSAEADLLRHALAESFVRVAAGSMPEFAATTRDILVSKFRDLVASHGIVERRLDFYARALGCTERTLSRRVQNELGVSPMHYMHALLAAEATRLLRFTNASCSDVADELGFADPSYFSRFYARMTGQRPSEVRGSVG